MLLLFWSFVILLFIGVPIGISTGLSAILAMNFSDGLPLEVTVQKMFAGLDVFPLMAIPFFIFAGDLMLMGGISKRLIDVANNLVGWITGGLAITGVLASMFFAALSGSSPATVAAIGGILIPSLEEAKYPKRFGTGLLCAAGSLGIIIPPSITFLVYGVVTETSIKDLFIAGIMPGIFIGAVLMVVSYFVGKKYNIPRTPRPNLKDIYNVTKKGIWAILMPLIVLGGIYRGTFTPTEASAIAVGYSLFVALFIYREVKLKDIVEIAKKSVVVSTIIMFIISNAQILSWYLTFERVPGKIAMEIIRIADSPITILLAINLLLLIVGMIMDTSAAVLILAPLFLPVIIQYGIDPVHFGVIMICNLAIGMLTPPFGLNLFVTTGITGWPISEVVRSVMPFIIILIGTLMVITFVPSLSLILIR